MTAWIVSNLWLALALTSGAALAALALARSCRDPVARHRVLVVFLPVVGLVPLVQLAVGEASPRSPGMGERASISDRVRREARLTVVESLDGAVVGPASERAAASVGASRGASARDAGVLIAYGVGAGALLMVIGLRSVQTARLLRTCTRVREARVMALWRSLARRSGARRAELLESARACAPGCWGVVRPRVVLPSSEVARGDTERLSLVLRHELVHVARRDVPIAVAQQVIRALLWFNPLVWVYSSALSRYRELSCDAIVVRETGKHQSYALALLEYCGPRRVGVGALLGLAMAEGSHAHIRRRLDMILADQQQQRTWSRMPRVVTAAVAGLVLGGSVAGAAMFGPGPIPRAQPEKKAKENAPAQAEKPAKPDAEVRLVADELVLEKEREAPWREVRVAIPAIRRELKVVEMEEAFGRPIARSGTLTEQETLVSGDKVTVRENVLIAADLVVNMPEGSRLRSTIEGESITVHQREPLQLKITKGGVRVIDDTGVARVTVRVAAGGKFAIKPTIEKSADGNGATVQLGFAPAEGTLVVTLEESRGELVMRFKATKEDGTPADVEAELDLKTGIPQDEERPPAGAVRYQLFDGDEKEARPVKVKMQWTHDLSKVKDDEEARVVR